MRPRVARAARRPTGGTPRLHACPRIEGDDSTVRGADVHPLANDKRRRLRLAEAAGAAAAQRTGAFSRPLTAVGIPCRHGQRLRIGGLHVIGPGDLQPGDIGSIDLRQRRITHPARVAAIGRPLICRLCIGGRGHEAGHKRKGHRGRGLLRRCSCRPPHHRFEMPTVMSLPMGLALKGSYPKAALKNGGSRLSRLLPSRSTSAFARAPEDSSK